MSKNTNLEDLDKLIWAQLKEDREMIVSQYKEIREMASGSIEKVAVLGDSMVKTSDLLIKQTGQLLEFLKVSKKEEKNTSEELSLSEEDKMNISEALKQ
jgi:hypothetical protein